MRKLRICNLRTRGRDSHPGQSRVLLGCRQCGSISGSCISRQKILWGNHDLQEDLGIGYDCSIGGNELDCELGLTARATGQDELQIANFVPFQLPTCIAKRSTLRQRGPLWQPC